MPMGVPTLSQGLGALRAAGGVNAGSDSDDSMLDPFDVDSGRDSDDEDGDSIEDGVTDAADDGDEELTAQALGELALEERAVVEPEAGAGAGSAAKPKPPAPKISLNPARHGTQLLLKDLVLHGIGVAGAAWVSVLVQCTRCATMVPAFLKPEEAVPPPFIPGPEAEDEEVVQSTIPTLITPLQYKAWCEKCSNLCELGLRRQLLHARSPSIGYLDEHGCVAVDLLHTYLRVSCLSCDGETDLPSFQHGKPWDKACRCGARLKVHASGYDLVRVTPGPTVASYGSHPRGPRSKPLFTFSSGKPLPGGGICAHYKRSRRWFRFPCCNRVFPCDVCHDEASDHPLEWAKRMICGNCSVEQVLSRKPCKSCGFDFDRPARSKHWEGGKGCRDTTAMSSKDSKKYRGKNKTVSQKLKSVGRPTKK